MTRAPAKTINQPRHVKPQRSFREKIPHSFCEEWLEEGIALTALLRTNFKKWQSGRRTPDQHFSDPTKTRDAIV